MQIFDGRKTRDIILKEMKNEVAKLSFVPVFCDVMVGDDPVSMQYVRMKRDRAKSVGISFHDAFFKAMITTDELVTEIEKLNNIENMCGIIVQLPLPKHIDARLVLDAITPKLDVDFLGSVASKKFYRGETKRGFPTALACMTILDSLKIDLKDKNIVVLGQGDLVGRPTTVLLGMRGLNPTVVTSKTPNQSDIFKNADIIISGIGKGKYIKGDMIKKGVILIDAGTSEKDGGVVGDVDIESVTGIASFVSPVPGGVGPVTVAMLLKNVLIVAKNLK